MTDLALQWDATSFSGDLALTGGKLASDEGMRTAIYISLFTDARAPADATLPEDGSDRRGWWGNDFSDIADDRKAQELGSLLWLLRRAKITSANIALAKTYAMDALQWLVKDNIVQTLDVAVEAQAGDRMAIGVIITRPSGPQRQRYDFTWEASL